MSYINLYNVHLCMYLHVGSAHDEQASPVANEKQRVCLGMLVLPGAAARCRALMEDITAFEATGTGGKCSGPRHVLTFAWLPKHDVQNESVCSAVWEVDMCQKAP